MLAALRVAVFELFMNNITNTFLHAQYGQFTFITYHPPLFDTTVQYPPPSIHRRLYVVSELPSAHSVSPIRCHRQPSCLAVCRPCTDLPHMPQFLPSAFKRSLPITHSQLFTVQCRLYTLHRILSTVHCSKSIIHCPKFTFRCPQTCLLSTSHVLTRTFQVSSFASPTCLGPVLSAVPRPPRLGMDCLLVW